jgi:hypothetical protein
MCLSEGPGDPGFHRFGHDKGITAGPLSTTCSLTLQEELRSSCSSKIHIMGLAGGPCPPWYPQNLVSGSLNLLHIFWGGLGFELRTSRLLGGSPNLFNTQLTSGQKNGRFVQIDVCSVNFSSQDVTSARNLPFLTAANLPPFEVGTQPLLYAPAMPVRPSVTTCNARTSLCYHRCPGLAVHPLRARSLSELAQHFIVP